MTKNEPDLEALGLNEPAKVSNKISIERLQRESEFERESASRPVVSRGSERNVGLDVAACLVTLLIPGSGHMAKGHWSAGFLWLVGVVGIFFLYWPIALVLQIFCIVSAGVTTPKN